MRRKDLRSTPTAERIAIAGGAPPISAVMHAYHFPACRRGGARVFFRSLRARLCCAALLGLVSLWILTRDPWPYPFDVLQAPMLVVMLAFCVPARPCISGGCGA